MKVDWTSYALWNSFIKYWNQIPVRLHCRLLSHTCPNSSWHSQGQLSCLRVWQICFLYVHGNLTVNLWMHDLNCSKHSLSVVRSMTLECKKTFTYMIICISSGYKNLISIEKWYYVSTSFCFDFDRLILLWWTKHTLLHYNT